MSDLLHRIGYSQQVPARRVIERNPEAIASWHRRRRPSVSGSQRRLDLLSGRGKPGAALRQLLGGEPVTVTDLLIVTVVSTRGYAAIRLDRLIHTTPPAPGTQPRPGLAIP